ncbi:MAG: winged helix-turn-helix transcriptional regulator [Candidatus Diapherotrites archaeon]|nr:winged helix-turn-helix transcriptional regulator [Candidatus Diapherotrites archaeon]
MTNNWDLYEQRELLLLDTRQRILEAIYRKPGLHFRELARATGLATGQLEYHIYRLEKAGLIRAEKDGKYTRYYPPMDYEESVKEVLKLLNRPRVKEILEFVAENEPARTEDISKYVGLSQSATLWHLRKLVDAGVLAESKDGREKRYSLTNRSAVLQALKIHKDGLLDELARKLAEMWEW